MGDRAPDPAEAENPDPFSAHLGGEGEAARYPVAPAYVAVGGGESAHHIDQRAHGEVGDTVGEHVRGVAHLDPAGAGPRDVRRLVADPEVDDGA